MHTEQASLRSCDIKTFKDSSSNVPPASPTSTFSSPKYRQVLPIFASSPLQRPWHLPYASLVQNFPMCMYMYADYSSIRPDISINTEPSTVVNQKSDQLSIFIRQIWVVGPWEDMVYHKVIFRRIKVFVSTYGQLMKWIPTVGPATWCCFSLDQPFAIWCRHPGLVPRSPDHAFRQPWCLVVQQNCSMTSFLFIFFFPFPSHTKLLLENEEMSPRQMKRHGHGCVTNRLLLLLANLWLVDIGRTTERIVVWNRPARPVSIENDIVKASSSYALHSFLQRSKGPLMSKFIPLAAAEREQHWNVGH